MSSLGGQNSHRRMSGARSSRASSTIFYKLRKLDRAIGLIDLELSLYKGWKLMPSYFSRVFKKRQKLDEKRKLIRQQRKKL